MTDPTIKSSLDAALEKEIADALGDQSIEAMLSEGDVPAAAARNASSSDDDEAPARDAAPSRSRLGTVAGVKGDDVFVEFGQKEQGICPVSAFGQKPPRVGEHIEFLIHSFDEANNLLRLTLPGTTTKADWASLTEGMTVEALVVGMNTGGLELKLANQRAFMPISQIDLSRVEDMTPYLNKKLRCKVVELNKRKRRLILSRRAVLDEEQAANRANLLKEIEVGQTREGVVKNIQKFGAFVELMPGVEGLVHVSDMAWSRVEDPASVVQAGQTITVQVLKVSEDGSRISLGMKQTMPDPWSSTLSKVAVGQDVGGKVTRITEFGAFVEIEPGVEGLIHISQLSNDRVKRVEDIVTVGSEVKTRVVAVEPEKKRISLSIKALTATESAAPIEKPSGDDFRRYVTREKKSHAGESLGSLLSKFADPNTTKGPRGGI
jgi:small subunit ribosomal protein S1